MVLVVYAIIQLRDYYPFVARLSPLHYSSQNTLTYLQAPAYILHCSFTHSSTSRNKLVAIIIPLQLQDFPASVEVIQICI